MHHDLAASDGLGSRRHQPSFGGGMASSEASNAREGIGLRGRAAECVESTAVMKKHFWNGFKASLSAQSRQRAESEPRSSESREKKKNKVTNFKTANYSGGEPWRHRDVSSKCFHRPLWGGEVGGEANARTWAYGYSNLVKAARLTASLNR